ncbi:uncharacterized protein CIMG_08346 [Coccidioides immitis RS]|uniref:PNPLA domain-containing protein n=1 Tax=Coccidioides immitis (strain RS) TaxID=246410 RepID=A0A0E1RW24_COCIM|nr:uncharacterized protein CIMG_08346 [Coccidioides immitis RS]EAS29600.2 hypothetical protein CIMG_08346 [Coccidioides immitis RS]
MVRELLAHTIKLCTAGPCVLSIDRGGSRVIISIQILYLMQKHLGPDLLLFIMVDFNIGTSSGGYIVLNINTGKYDIEETKDFFYDGGALNNVLARHFGPTVRMFETPWLIVLGGKVAVMAATIDNGSLFLFTNYNAEMLLRKNHRYRCFERGGKREPFIWKVAQATSAAPLLFPSIMVDSISSFQDGGVWPQNNNPAVLGLLETCCYLVAPFPKQLGFCNAMVDGWATHGYHTFMFLYDDEGSMEGLWSVMNDQMANTMYVLFWYFQ